MKNSDLLKIKIEKNYIIEIINHKEYNKVIIDYYKRLQEEMEMSLGNQIENISNCNSWWILDHYKSKRF